MSFNVASAREEFGDQLASRLFSQGVVVTTILLPASFSQDILEKLADDELRRGPDVGPTAVNEPQHPESFAKTFHFFLSARFFSVSHVPRFSQ